MKKSTPPSRGPEVELESIRNRLSRANRAGAQSNEDPTRKKRRFGRASENSTEPHQATTRRRLSSMARQRSQLSSTVHASHEDGNNASMVIMIEDASTPIVIEDAPAFQCPVCPSRCATLQGLGQHYYGHPICLREGKGHTIDGVKCSTCGKILLLTDLSTSVTVKVENEV